NHFLRRHGFGVGEDGGVIFGDDNQIVRSQLQPPFRVEGWDVAFEPGRAKAAPAVDHNGVDAVSAEGLDVTVHDLDAAGRFGVVVVKIEDAAGGHAWKLICVSHAIQRVRLYSSASMSQEPSSFVVNEADAGKRLDLFVSHQLKLTRNQVKRLLGRGAIRL